MSRTGQISTQERRGTPGRDRLADQLRVHGRSLAEALRGVLCLLREHFPLLCGLRQLWYKAVLSTWRKREAGTTHVCPDAVDQSSPTDLRASLAQRREPLIVGLGVEVHSGGLQPAEKIGPRRSVLVGRRDDMDVFELGARREGQVDQSSGCRVDGQPVDVLKVLCQPMPRQRRDLALTGPDEGRQPTSSAVRTSSGHASVSFQMPCSVSPHS